MLKFKPIEMADKPHIDRIISRYPRPICEGSFIDFYIWRGLFNTHIYLEDDLCIVLNYEKNDTNDQITETFYFPFGEPKSALNQLLEHTGRECKKITFSVLTKEQVDILGSLHKDRFEILPDRRRADYIYLTDSMISLAGKRLHSKRNFINRFKLQNEGRWSFEPLTQERVSEVIEYERKWFKSGDTRDSGATTESLLRFSELGADGGVLYLDGKIIGLSIGSPITDEIYDIRIEKAESGIAGAYQVLFNEFVKRFCRNYKYINREDDYGVEGLRKAKMSYCPHEILMKYTAREL